MVRITDNYLGCCLRLGAVVADLVACVAIAVNKDWHPGRCDSLQDDPAWCFLLFVKLRLSLTWHRFLLEFFGKPVVRTCFVSIEVFETGGTMWMSHGGRVSGLWRGNPSTYFMTSSPVAAFLHRTERSAHYNTKTQEQRRGCGRSSLSHLRQPRSGNRAGSSLGMNGHGKVFAFS